ncbi:putative signal peptide and transmembrane protein [Rhodopirellula islandica]|uniref:Signal peptide and transmembrane protein n=1 Tax=Rhodopirellula islandica TaxID=595434 RepID=A0A0J1B8A6_RHOIS|nr:hypothetical protein [Rhodopirellula islandica]KLU02947.1 putative signal peptide and transmembrane protein [Rhodopirellula islandica]
MKTRRVSEEGGPIGGWYHPDSIWKFWRRSVFRLLTSDVHPRFGSQTHAIDDVRRVLLAFTRMCCLLVIVTSPKLHSHDDEEFMNTPRANRQMMPSYLVATLPLRFFQASAVVACVLFARNIQADQPGAASPPVPHEQVSKGELERKQNSDQLIPGKEPVAPSFSGKVEKQAKRSDGGGETKGDATIDLGIIRLKFQGSFEVSRDGVGVARGEGTTTLEFDGELLDRFAHESGESSLGRQDFLDGILSLPSTIRSTNETLRMLSAPKTQEALRQVETLLRLLPQASTMPPVQIDAESNQEQSD